MPRKQITRNPRKTSRSFSKARSGRDPRPETLKILCTCLWRRQESARGPRHQESRTEFGKDGQRSSKAYKGLHGDLPRSSTYTQDSPGRAGGGLGFRALVGSGSGFGAFVGSG